MTQALRPGRPTRRRRRTTPKLAQFQELAKSLAGPRINSMWVWIDEDKEQATKGLRMMGQRFTLDEYVFGQLIWRNVGDRRITRAGCPKALDLLGGSGLR